MELDEFKEICMRTAIRKDSCYNLLYASNALCGEAGELANYVKKIYRDYGGVMQSEERVKLALEIFDVIWYCSYAADILDLSFKDICRLGFQKLEERQKNKTPGHGEG